MMIQAVCNGDKAGELDAPAIAPGHNVLEAPNVKFPIIRLLREELRVFFEHGFKFIPLTIHIILKFQGVVLDGRLVQTIEFLAGPFIHAVVLLSGAEPRGVE